MASHKNNIRILRAAGDTEKTKILYGDQEFYYLIIDNIKKVFIKELIKVEKGYDEKRIVTDYNLLTTFAGNDFVVAIPYLKVKDDRLRTPMGIYKKLLPVIGEHLVLIDKKGNYSLNHKFMLEFFKELSKAEEYRMRNIQKNIRRSVKLSFRSTYC